MPKRTTPSWKAPGSDERATLSDVARRAGVSAATVSRTINSPGMVAEKTVARVQQAIAETGYVPNLLAGGLAGQKSRFVAALVPSIASSILNETMEAMTWALADEGILTMLALLDEGPGHAAMLDAVLGRQPDGVILTSIENDETTRTKLRRSGATIIETWALPQDPIDLAVGFSHAAVGEALARYVWACGYRRPFSLYAAMTRARERAEAFARTWSELGGGEVAHCETPDPTQYGPARRQIGERLETGESPDVVVCSTDWMADAVVLELRARGVAPADEVGVVGFGDMHVASEGAVALSTVRIDGAQIGARAAQMLLARAAGEEIPEPVVDIGFEIIGRASTRAPAT